MDDLHPKPGFTENQRPEAAALFWQAFGGKLGRLLGPERRALDFLHPILDPSHCLSISNKAGRLLGIAGFKTTQGALVGGSSADLRRVYGGLGMLWRAPLLALVERPVEPGLLLMDGIAVHQDARGRGLGTKLLSGILDEARERSLGAVRLDVIDSNPRARALYERQGFVEQGTEDIFPFRWLFGFATATRMERVV